MGGNEKGNTSLFYNFFVIWFFILEKSLVPYILLMLKCKSPITQSGKASLELNAFAETKRHPLTNQMRKKSWKNMYYMSCYCQLPRYKVAILDQECYIKNYWNFQINTYQPLLLFKKSFKEFINLQEPKSWSEISIFITIYYHWSNFFSWLRQSQNSFFYSDGCHLL